MKLRCLHDGFLFAFLQEKVKGGLFVESTDWGFQIDPMKDRQKEGNDAFNRSLQEARWAKILTVGPECEEVEVGDYVAIEPMMHTNAFEHDGVKIYKSDESKVLIISKEKPNVHIAP